MTYNDKDLTIDKTQSMEQNIPDDCTCEDNKYHLYVIEKIQKSLKRSENGKAISHHTAKIRMANWLSN